MLAIAALTLAGLLLLTVLAVAWLLGTESGLRFAFARAAGYLPEGVEIGAVDGTASGPLLVQDVRVQAPGFSLALDRLELEWRLSGLLKREIRIERLYADGLRYAAREQPPPPEEDKEPFRLPERIDLPVDVFADDVRVRDIAVRGSAEAEPLVVDEVALVAQWTGRAAEIETLRIQAPLADAQAHASLVPRGDYPLEAELAYTVRPPDLAPLSGSTRLDGNLERLRLLQTLAAPYNLRLEATARDVLDELGFDATLEVTQAHVAHIAGNLPPADVTLRLEASGGLDAVRVELDARGSEPEIGAVDVELAGEVSPELIAIERLTANLANGRIDGGGRIELGGQEPRVDIGAEWSALQWPLQGNPRVASEKGRLEVKGTLEDYRARLDAALRVPNQADGHVTLAGTGNDRSFKLGTIEIATLEGTLQGAGEVAWTPVLGGRIDLAGRGLNPGGLAPDWPGSIDLAVRGEGSLPDTGARVRIDTLHAEGRLRGQPVSLDARGRFDDGTLALTELELRTGSTHLEADGRIGEEVAMDWSIASEDLAALLPDAGGRVEGRGNVAGSLQAPDITATLSGSGLRYGEYRLASLELDADIAAGGTARSEVTLALEGAALGGVDVRTLALEGAGTRSDHRVTLGAESSAGRLDLGIDGMLGPNEVLAFVIERLDYEHPSFEPWTLEAPARGRLAAETAALEPLCLTGGPARLCVEGERTRERLAARFELEDLPLAMANAFLPPTARLEGALNGTGSIAMAASAPGGGAAGLPTARVDLRTTPIRLLAGEQPEAMRPVLTFADGNVALDMNEANGAQLNLDLPLESGGGLRVDAEVAASTAPLTERTLEGRVRAQLPELGFLTEFTPQVSSLDGRIDGDIAISGTLAAPALDGRLALEDGAAVLPGPELDLQEVQAVVRGRGAGELDIEASARSGEGTLRIEGTAGTSEAGPRAELAIEGENFVVFNTREAVVHASPDIDVKLANERLDVTGIVRVPEAVIELTEVPESAVGVSPDQVIVQADAEQPAAAEALALNAEVQIILGDPGQAPTEASAGEEAAGRVEPRSIEDQPVRFTGFGLGAGLAGKVTVTQTATEPTTASGEINVTKGWYTAYGQDLEIQRGRVLFAGGPVSEPGLDVRAVRRPAEDVLVGVEVEGSLTEPRLTLFSDPQMSQTEQLSYLVLGRPLEGGPASESSALARAALALGIQGGNVLTQKFGDELGLDQIGIESGPGAGGGDTAADPSGGDDQAASGGATEQASLVVGKYLSPDLYVSYGIGLLEPVSTLKLSYALSSKWRLVTESSSEQSGGDLFYTIER